MKDRKHEVLKNLFREEILRRRYELKISQPEMAYRLNIEERSYADLENGKNCCGALTLAYYLIYICPDRDKFLSKLQKALEAIEEE